MISIIYIPIQRQIEDCQESDTIRSTILSIKRRRLLTALQIYWDYPTEIEPAKNSDYVPAVQPGAPGIIFHIGIGYTMVTRQTR